MGFREFLSSIGLEIFSHSLGFRELLSSIGLEIFSHSFGFRELLYYIGIEIFSHSWVFSPPDKLEEFFFDSTSVVSHFTNWYWV